MSSTVFRAFVNAGDGRRGVKRNRQPVSCSSCRSAKRRCDRQQPCGACVARGLAASCEVVSSQSTRLHNKNKKRDEAQARLQRLEQMVNTLVRVPVEAPENTRMQDVASSLYPSPADSGSSIGGHIQRQGTETIYHGATHWTAILEGIHDLQDLLDSESSSPLIDEMSYSSPGDNLDIAFGTSTLLTLDEIHALLPPRTTVTKLLSVYFNAKFNNFPFLHTCKFQREYENFWTDPSSTSFLWLSILLSILFMAVRIAAARNEPLGDGDLDATIFLQTSGRCLVTGQYQRAYPYAIEALVVYSMAKYMLREDPDASLWATFTLATRLAQRMGYHREPSSLGLKFSPFEAEIRRRVWFFIETFDVLFAFQLGMPAVVHEDECDTRLPQNLADEDFDEDTTLLPPPRRDTEVSLILFYCYKARLVRLLRRVIRHALAIKSPAYAETLALDEELHALHDEIPTCLANRPVQSSSLTDPNYVIVFRLILEQLYLRCLCILHRSYLSLPQYHDTTFARSRDICVNAALQLLDLQAEVHMESQPQGRLYADQWMLGSVARNGYLVAAMIVSLALSRSFTSHDTAQKKERDRKLTSLRTSYGIWAERKAISTEATHATRVLGAVLRRFNEHNEEYKAISDSPKSFKNYSQSHIKARTGTQEMYNVPLDNGLTRPTLSSSSSNELINPTFQQDFPSSSEAVEASSVSAHDIGLYDVPIDYSLLDTILNEDQIGDIDWNLVDQYLTQAG